MTLFELQAWLGQRSPQSTRFHAKITPNTLTKAYDDAGYFARNVRAIEVLLDRDAATLQYRRHRPAVPALRPRPRPVLLHLLRGMSPPDGLHQMRLLYSQGLDEGPTV
ncbi:hypothetical protein GCM10023085_50850 [Actinomadura viridis]